MCECGKQKKFSSTIYMQSIIHQNDDDCRHLFVCLVEKIAKKNL